MAKAARKKTSSTKQRRDLSAIPAAELAAELKRRERRMRTLVRRHVRMMDAAAKLRAEIEALGGSTGAGASAGGPGGRPQNKTNLVDALKGVLAGKTLRVSEAARKVLEAGYKSTSASFRQIVNQTLADSDQFERVERGRYTVKAP